jgi:hypothetical protein
MGSEIGTMMHKPLPEARILPDNVRPADTGATREHCRGISDGQAPERRAVFSAGASRMSREDEPRIVRTI